MSDPLQAYKQDLAIKGFSPKTQKTYFACVRKFLVAAGKPPDALAKDDVKSHLFRILDSGKCSVSTMNQTYTPYYSVFYFHTRQQAFNSFLHCGNRKPL